MYKSLLIFFILSLLLFCGRNTLGIEKNLLQSLDSNTIMYCKINNSLFNGKYYHVSKLPSRGDDFYTVLRAFFPSENVEIELKKLMMTTEKHHLYKSIVRTNNRTYIIASDQPYGLNTDILTDSLVSGTFFGTFVNKQNNDTVRISEGYFNTLPHKMNNSNSSLRINGRSSSTSFVREYFERNQHLLMAVDTSFQDSLIAYITINLKTFSSNFIKEYHILSFPMSSTLNFSLISKISDFRAKYKGQSGSMKVSELDDYEKDGIILQRIGKARFEFDAKSDENETIKIRNGNFSIIGFN